MPTRPIRIAILDLYNGEPNQGMRAIRELLVRSNGRFFGQPLTFDIFETRLKAELPNAEYDVYISSGGPGSPFDGEGKSWERQYFRWLDAVWNHNERLSHEERESAARHVLFICHSFQMMCRFFELADVVPRKSQSFGIFPVHMTEAGRLDPLFETLRDPFYAADFRHWQVVQKNDRRLAELGASVLAREKMRPHVPLERAIMAIRVSPEMVGVQFHPEADPQGMHLHFRQPERMQEIVRKHGQDKYERILHRLEDPNYLAHTHDRLIPNFLRRAVQVLRPDAAANRAA